MITITEEITKDTVKKTIVEAVKLNMKEKGWSKEQAFREVWHTDKLMRLGVELGYFTFEHGLNTTYRMFTDNLKELTKEGYLIYTSLINYPYTGAVEYILSFKGEKWIESELNR